MLLVGGENLMDMVQIGEKDGQSLYQAIPGGSPFNVALAAGRQQVPVRYITPISDDTSGDQLAALLSDAGVELGGARFVAPTSLAMVSLIEGIPSYAFYRNGTAERLVTTSALNAHLADNPSIFHIGSLAITGGEDAAIWEAFAHAAKAQGLLISLDPNIRASFISDVPDYMARLGRILAISDIVKLSDEDLAWLYKDQSEEAALGQLRSMTNADIVVLTRGGEGARFYHAGSWQDVDPAQVSDLKDTVGAGDTFMASMLAWLMGHADLKNLASLTGADKGQMVRHAAKAAAMNCERQGCNPPTSDELNKL